VIVEVSDDNFEGEVLRSAIPVLVDFWASYCHPCVLLAPVIEEIAREYGGRLKVCKFDVEQDARIPSEYGIMGIPTLLLFSNGEAKEQMVGYLPREHIVEKIKPYI